MWLTILSTRKASNEASLTYVQSKKNPAEELGYKSMAGMYKPAF